jgi:hypothetical protein
MEESLKIVYFTQRIACDKAILKDLLGSDFRGEGTLQPIH